MAIVNGGYAKITKRIYMIEMRDADGRSCCEIIHESNRKVAVARAFGNGKGAYTKVGSVLVEGEGMNASDRDMCREYLFGISPATIPAQVNWPALDLY